MEHAIDHNALDALLRICGSNWDAAQTHGLLSGRLAIAGPDSGFDWLAQVLEGTEEAGSGRTECETMLSALFAATYRQLSERLSVFEPLLPDDDESTASRAAALAHWCEGFLHGVVSAEHGDALKERLAAQPLSDIIRDMLQITRAAADEDTDEDTDDESDDAAYTELVEYLRVATQLAYEELADIRHGPANIGAGTDAVH